jgi:site-specific recombinase XerD
MSLKVKVDYRADRGKWQVTYSDPETGKRRRPLFDRETDARNLKRKLELGVSVEDKDSMPIDKAVQTYFGEISLKKKSRVSISNDRRYFNLFFHFMTVERGLETLGSISLQDMEALQGWLETQKEYDGKPLSMGPSTVNRAFHSYRHFFRKHVQWGNRTDSPCAFLDNLTEEQNDRRPMTAEEYDLVYAATPTWFQPTLRFIQMTGVPGSCIERLNWSDVDFSSRQYVIQRKKGSKAQLKKITLPMTEELHKLLMGLWENSADKAGAVFRNESGTRLTADWISKMGTRSIQAAGLKGVVLYCLRHSLATDLIEANVSIGLAQKALGHSSITTTQGYSKKVRSSALAGALTLVRGGLVADRCHQETKPSPAGGTAETA